MAQNHALNSTQLKDLLFTEDNIVMNVSDRQSIFELKDEGHTSLGFISSHNLRTYAQEHEIELTGMSVRNIDSIDWVGVYEHPLFQRRKPQIVSSNPTLDSDQQFYILRQGQKVGPYQKAELITMLDEKEILLTDMVSYNSGYTWIKLFQLEDFDRRVLKESDTLPGIPLEAISHHTDYSVGISEATEAISGLAYLSNVKRGKIVEREVMPMGKADTVVKTGEFSLHKWMLIVSVVGVSYFVYHLKNELSSPFKEENPSIGEQAEVLTPVETSTPSSAPRSQVFDQRRTGGKFQSRQMNPVIPRPRKSFMESPQFQEVNNEIQPNDADDPNYYYDNTSAMELDPVRSQVSKENFDNGGAEGNPTDGPIPSQDQVFENEVGN